MYGITCLCIISNRFLNCEESRGYRRCASHTFWNETLYEEGRRIDEEDGRGVNISDGSELSSLRSGIREVRMKCRFW